GLVGGFYESLTCKVVTLPACEDPLPLPAWLGLPEASVGGVIGILPLLGIFLAKALQPKRVPEEVGAEEGVAAGPLPRNYFVFEKEGGVHSVLATDHLPAALLPAGAQADPRPWRERLLPGLVAWLSAN